MEAGSRTNCKPNASGRCAIRRLISIDQAEAGLSFALIDVEADSAAVGQLLMATRAHQFTGVRISPALQEQFGNTALQRFDFCPLGISSF
jgi:hypothetical protein